MERLPSITNPRVSHSTKLREFVLFISPQGRAKRTFHNPPGRLLAIWLDGEVEFETSDGEVRRVSAGKPVLVEDVHGKGHISRHPPEGQNVIQVILPHGLDAPAA